MDRSERLFNVMLDRLEDIDANHHSCLHDMVLLTDYQKIMRMKLEDDDMSDINDRYSGQYKFFVAAAKVRLYLEQNVEEYYSISEWELFVRLKNGDKFIYDEYYNSVNFPQYENDNLTEKQEKLEFGKNLKKLMDHKWMNQEELANQLGITQVAISQYINGKRIPNTMMLRKISKILNCSIDDLFYKHF